MISFEIPAYSYSEKSLAYFSIAETLSFGGLKNMSDTNSIISESILRTRKGNCWHGPFAPVHYLWEDIGAYYSKAGQITGYEFAGRGTDVFRKPAEAVRVFVETPKTAIMPVSKTRKNNS